MPATSVQKLAKVLKVLVTITLVCNLIALILVPGLAMMKGFQPLLELTPYERSWEVPARVLIAFLLGWKWVWTSGAYDVVLTIFLLFCGVCTAVILWQARRVLDTILTGPFRPPTESVSAGRRCAVFSSRPPHWSGCCGGSGITPPSCPS